MNTLYLALGALTILTPAAMSPVLAQDKTPPPARDDKTPGRTAPDRADAPPKHDEAATPDRTQKEQSAPAPASEADFVQKAAKSGKAEVKLAQLAERKAEAPGVKELARMLIKDHTAANEQLKEAAKKANHTLDETPDLKAEEKYNEISKKEGKEFDEAFLNETAMCHHKSIALFQAGRKVAKSEGITAFIDKTLPVIEGHAKKIQTLKPHAPTTADDRAPATPRGVKPGTSPGPATDPAPDAEKRTDRRSPQ